jgi:segregation and condensation protein A
LVSGERSDPRGSEDDHRESSDAPPASEDDRNDDGTDPDEAADDIPLNIAGHEAEKARRERKTDPGPVEAGGTAGASDAESGDGLESDADAESGAESEAAVLSDFDVDGAAADDEEVEPVELLVQLAEDGEIDPWDIDVVRVTDKFLDRLDAADLRTGGRALFYASVLLRMKSDVLWGDEEPETEAEPATEPWEMAPGEGEVPPAQDPFAELEREMDRRIERKRARGTPETLDELVRDLRERERDTWWKESRTYDTSESPSGYSRGAQTLDYRAGDDYRMDDEPTADDVTGTAHDEHMEDIINDVYVAVQTHYDAGREEVLFAEIRDAGGSVVDTFLGLLFLGHRGRVHLEQDDCFGDLWIQDPAAVEPGETPAPADD